MNLRLKDILEERNISLTSISEKTGIEKGNLSAISNNKKNPTIETLEKIAQSLNIELWELFTSTTSKDELTALISHRGEFYKATTVKELEEIVQKIKDSYKD